MASAPGSFDFFEASRAAVKDHELRRKLANASGRHLEHLAEVVADFPPYEAERDRAREIKADAIGRLDELLAQLKARLEAAGCKVFFAAERRRGARLRARRRARMRRQARGEGQVDDQRGDRAQSRVRSGGDRGDRNRPRRIYRPTPRRAPLAYHHAGDPSLERGHRPALRQQVRNSLHFGARGAHRSRAPAPARGVPERRAGRGGRQFRDRGDRHAGDGRERGQRPAVLLDARDLRRPDGNREGHSPARRPEPFPRNSGAHRDRAEAHHLHHAC